MAAENYRQLSELRLVLCPYLTVRIRPDFSATNFLFNAVGMGIWTGPFISACKQLTCGGGIRIAVPSFNPVLD